MDDVKKTAATSTESTVEVPENLKRFVGEDGKVDFEKVSQSFREAEGKVTKTSQEAATLKQAYDQIVSTIGNKTAEGATVVGKTATGRKLTVEEIVADPDAAIRGAARGEFENLAKPVVDMLIAVAHPEVAETIGEDGSTVYGDPEFVDSLQKYMARLPVGMKQAIANRDYATIDHVIKTVKGLRKKAASVDTDEGKEKGLKTNFAEGGKGPVKKSNGKIWTRSEIRELYTRNRSEYARREDEITKAYDEDRVEDR